VRERRTHTHSHLYINSTNDQGLRSLQMPGLEKSIDECLAKKRDQEREFESQEKKADHEINDMAVNMHKNADYEKKVP